MGREHNADLADPHSIHKLCKTVRAIGMSENAIGRHRTMCFSVRPPCNPTLMIKGMCGLVSNESAHTTDGEQRRLSSRSGRRRMNYFSEHGFTSYSPLPSIILHQAKPRTATRRDANPRTDRFCFRAAVYGTGESPSSPSCREQLGCVLFTIVYVEPATSASPRGQRTVPADLTVADRDGMPGAYFRYHRHQLSFTSE